MEHVVLRRLNEYVETEGLFPHTMVGFRPNLSTQDIMWQLQHDIFQPGPIRATRTILALDISKAFDGVTQSSILTNLSQMNLGKRSYTYISNFLGERTAEIHLGNLKSERFTLGTRGTPQGAVLSPFLFNITMRNLPALLDAIPHVKHSIYADYIRIWTNSGSDGEITEALQAAADTVKNYVKLNGLTCSAQKSELLIIKSRTDKTNGPCRSPRLRF